MFFLSKLCFLCLGTNKNLKLVLSEKSDGGLIQEELKYCLPEIVDSHSEIPKYMCSNCMNKLQKFYKFKETCLQNNRYLKRYCQTLTSTDIDESYKHISVTVTDIKYKNKLQSVSSDQTMPTVGSNELSTGENLDNGSCIQETTLNSEIQCDALLLGSGQSHSLFKEVDIVVKAEFVPSEGNADNEFYQEILERIKCEPMPSDSDVSVSSIAHEDSTDSNSNSDKKDPTNPQETDNNSTSNKSSKRRYKCRDCHRAFTWLSHLEVHSLIHTGERPFKCQTCQKTFTQAVTLKQHKFTHTGERPHECDVCHKTFNKKSSLIEHKRIRPYQCTHCNYTCTRSGHLSKHMRIHTGEKPHHCPMCPYKCAYASALKTHIRTHTGEKPYSCQHCQKSFTTSSHLGRHKRTHLCNEEA